MAQFQFQDEDPIARKAGKKPSAPGIAGLIMKMGLAKTPQGANVVMVVITVICVAIIIFQQWM